MHQLHFPLLLVSIATHQANPLIFQGLVCSISPHATLTRISPFFLSFFFGVMWWHETGFTFTFSNVVFGTLWNIGRGKGVSTATSDMVTIRAMGQTFRVRNQLPIIRVSSVTKATSCNNSNMNDNNNYTEKKDVASVTATAHSEPLDAALSTIVEEIPSPISSSSPDEDSVAVSLVAGDTTCADQSDYQDFLSKFGILSLSLNVNETTRHSIAKIDSPNDDTLVSGSTSLCVSEVASPVLESFPELTPEPLSLPTPTEQWTGQRPSSLNCSPAAQTVDHQQQDPSASRPVDESTPIEPPTPDPAGPAGGKWTVEPPLCPHFSLLGSISF